MVLKNGLSMLNLCNHLTRRFVTNGAYPSSSLKIPRFQPNLEFILDPQNHQSIRDNIKKRKGHGDFDQVLEFAKEGTESSAFLEAAHKLPNETHPESFALDRNPKVIQNIPFTHELMKNSEKQSQIRSFESLLRGNFAIRNHNLSHFSGERSYYLLDQVAQMEHALVNYTIDRLTQDYGFELISVPDLLHPGLVEACGMPTQGQRTQIYHLESFYGPQVLSGTSEIALASFFMNKIVEQPRKMCSVSRCFRAEASKIKAEKGIYRVHQFTKVEMFAVSQGGLKSSSDMLEHFLEIQKTLFSDLGLAFQVLLMPSHELGAPAYQKYDIEAYLPSRKLFGEISSSSNCTDFQSRRLNIRDGQDGFCHTINGTACAVPRMIMALIEQYQKAKMKIDIPEVLRPYMKANTFSARPKSQRLSLNFVQSPKRFHKPS